MVRPREVGRHDRGGDRPLGQKWAGQGRPDPLDGQRGWRWLAVQRIERPCRLHPVLPPSLSWAEVTADPQALSPASRSIPVWVTETSFTGARDPSPYLKNPTIVEGKRSVTVYWTVTPPDGAQECPGNPRVERVLELREPLGDRVLLDGSRWPPRIATRPIRY